jgi:hypothetical protein
MGWSTSPNAYGQPTITKRTPPTGCKVYAVQPFLGVERMFWCCFRDVGTDPLNVEHHFACCAMTKARSRDIPIAALATSWFTKSTPTHGSTGPFAPVTLGWTPAGATGYDTASRPAPAASATVRGPTSKRVEHLIPRPSRTRMELAGPSQTRDRPGRRRQQYEWWSFRTTDAFTGAPPSTVAAEQHDADGDAKSELTVFRCPTAPGMFATGPGLQQRRRERVSMGAAG